MWVSVCARQTPLSESQAVRFSWQRIWSRIGRQQWKYPQPLAASLHIDSNHSIDAPFRKQWKENAKKEGQARRLADQDASLVKDEPPVSSKHERWTLTVGLEIHAQLNTDRKLFSGALTAHGDTPNSNVALFDLAFPGSQPIFQQATLIPALRAALALSCNIQRKSRFDRKHYYYQDQPAGYQITQYYEPFATNGSVTVYDYDGIAPADGKSIKVGIKQIQMEQDTAKSTLQPPSTALLDFNRVGHPLVEIITLPEIHHPQTAAACVRKIQAILQAINAVTTGMELGGLRADVNVSVSAQGSDRLGQRTEIKNLSSFRAVEDAIFAERERQIAVLESGGIIHGETRGWTIGSNETVKLRGKEGEVDYRYMPDPDIPPLVIGQGLVTHVAEGLPELPDDTINDLTNKSGLTLKDAKTLAVLDDGERLEYFDEVRFQCSKLGLNAVDLTRNVDVTIANWVLHELGGLLKNTDAAFSQNIVPAKTLADILSTLDQGLITGSTAKRLFAMVFDGDTRMIHQIIEQENLGLRPLSEGEYLAMAQALLDQNQAKVKQIQQKKQLGKLQFFIGQMMRQGEGRVEASKAERALKELLGLG